MNTSYDLWIQETDFLEKLKQKNPKLAERSKPFIEDKIQLKNYGIDIFPELPLGFLRFSPLDFIVEEITFDGRIVTIDPADDQSLTNQEGEIVFADMIKIGVYTLSAVERIVKTLKINPENIGYAGIKDAIALTSQRISFKEISREKIKELKIPSLYFKNVFTGAGMIQQGNLQGNRFTIFIRTKELYDPNKLFVRIKDIKENGFYNFYGGQRFGRGPRKIAHKLGALLFRGQFELAIKAMLIAVLGDEMPIVQQMRAEAKKHYGDWPKIIQIFSPMPHTFQHEIEVLESLIAKPNDYLSALTKIKDQVKLWVYAYVSYLFNKQISRFVKNNINLPAKFPLVLSYKRQDIDFYGDLLKNDKTNNFINNLKPLSFISLRHREVQTKLYPEINSFCCLPEGAAISFNLSKGAYATTLLSHIFTLITDTPVPGWVSQKEIDSLKTLELGTIDNTKKVLGEYFFNILGDNKK